LGTTLAFIEKGSMRYFYQLEEKQVCKDFIFENSLVTSFASLFSHDPSSIFIDAMEDTEIVEMSYADVLQLYEEYPVWQKLGRIVVQENIIRAERREAALLKELPEDRFRALVEEHPKSSSRFRFNI
jgi:CRP-like cAMP-binding protein